MKMVLSFPGIWIVGIGHSWCVRTSFVEIITCPRCPFIWSSQVASSLSFPCHLTRYFEVVHRIDSTSLVWIVGIMVTGLLLFVTKSLVQWLEWEMYKEPDCIWGISTVALLLIYSYPWSVHMLTDLSTEQID